ncbi:MAG: hypothetical protein ABJL67_12370 [Sulfitobacter sp.]
MAQFFTQTPIWVWPLFLLLLLVGLRASARRSVHVIPIYLLPLLGLLGVQSLSAMNVAAGIWVLFVLAYSIGGGLGYLMQGRWILSRAQRHVELVGETLTLTAMMVLFVANFAAGLTQATLPDVYQSVVFAVVFSGLVGVFSGSFAGRALRVWRH